MKRKLNTDNGLQRRTTEHQLPTAVLQKWRCSALYDSEVVNQNLVLRLKFSGENRHLRKARNRWHQALKDKKHDNILQRQLKHFITMWHIYFLQNKLQAKK